METFLLAAAVVALAAGVAVAVQRRRPQVPTQGGYAVPTQIDRTEFADEDCPWLVLVFTSATCDSCADTLAKAQVLQADGAVSVQNIEVSDRPDLHGRYRIDAVPLVVMADADGVVRRSFVGPPSATDLWETLARIRSDAAEENYRG